MFLMPPPRPSSLASLLLGALIFASAPSANAAKAGAPANVVDDDYPRTVDGEVVFDRRRVDVPPEGDLRIFVELPYLMSTRTSITGAGATFEGSPSIRGGAFLPVPDALSFLNALGSPAFIGGDIALGGNMSYQGTAKFEDTNGIHSVQFLSLLEARAILGVDFELPIFTVMPFAFGGAAVGAGMISSDLLGVTRQTPKFVLALRTGVGLIAKLGWFTIRIDSGGGIRNGRPEVVGSLAAGLMF